MPRARSSGSSDPITSSPAGMTCLNLALTAASRRGLRSDRLDLDLPVLGGGHPRAIGLRPHEATGRRSVGNEDHAPGHLPFLAEKRRLAPVLRPDPDGPARSDPQGLQVLGVQGQSAYDRRVLTVVLADVDLLALLAG